MWCIIFIETIRNNLNCFTSLSPHVSSRYGLASVEQFTPPLRQRSSLVVHTWPHIHLIPWYIESRRWDIVCECIDRQSWVFYLVFGSDDTGHRSWIMKWVVSIKIISSCRDMLRIFSPVVLETIGACTSEIACFSKYRSIYFIRSSKGLDIWYTLQRILVYLLQERKLVSSESQ